MLGNGGTNPFQMFLDFGGGLPEPLIAHDLTQIHKFHTAIIKLLPVEKAELPEITQCLGRRFGQGLKDKYFSLGRGIIETNLLGEGGLS